MQLFEAIAWQYQPDKDGNCPNENQIATRLAFIANVTQPIILAFGFIAFTDIPRVSKVIALAVVFAYICWLLYVVNESDRVNCLKPKENCKHLDLTWWSKYDLGPIPYIITLIFVIFLLVKPFDLAVLEFIIIFITLLISIFIYRCGTGSVWCWFAASAPIITGIYWYIRTERYPEMSELDFDMETI
jgi:hypothetical protein